MCCRAGWQTPVWLEPIPPNRYAVRPDDAVPSDDLRSGKAGVWLVEGETPRVTWRAVQVAGLGAEEASVVGQLEPGDRVVALGAHLLHEGDHVQLAERKVAARVVVTGGEQP